MRRFRAPFRAARAVTVPVPPPPCAVPVRRYGADHSCPGSQRRHTHNECEPASTQHGPPPTRWHSGLRWRSQACPHVGRVQLSSCPAEKRGELGHRFARWAAPRTPPAAESASGSPFLGWSRTLDTLRSTAFQTHQDTRHQLGGRGELPRAVVAAVVVAVVAAVVAAVMTQLAGHHSPTTEAHGRGCLTRTRSSQRHWEGRPHVNGGEGGCSTWHSCGASR